MTLHAFTDPATFDAWHTEAKTAQGIPRAGVNAKTGEPAPDKQWTTAYTEPRQTLADGTTIAPTDAGDTLPQSTPAPIPPWKAGEAVAKDALRVYAGRVVVCYQAHTTQADWYPLEPSTAPGTAPTLHVAALWGLDKVVTGPTPDPWVQPTGAQDAYKIGDRVTFEGKVYESKINANSWSPAVYPAGWQLIT